MEQGSKEWVQSRLGKVTASRVADLMAKTKTGWGAGRANYMAELISERLTGVPADNYSSAAMQWGTDTEPQARTDYEFLTNRIVNQVGMIEHPTIPMTGASPDGLIADDGLIEIKCPNTATHIGTLLNRRVPEKYITQMQWQMACTGRQWCDFVSFDPRLPPAMKLWITTIPRDDKRIAELEQAVIAFLAELDAKLKALRDLYQ